MARGGPVWPGARLSPEEVAPSAGAASNGRGHNDTGVRSQTTLTGLARTDVWAEGGAKRRSNPALADETSENFIRANLGGGDGIYDGSEIGSTASRQGLNA